MKKISRQSGGVLVVELSTVFACWRRMNLGFQCKAWESLQYKASPLSQGAGACVWGGAIGGPGLRAEGLESKEEQNQTVKKVVLIMMSRKVAWWWSGDGFEREMKRWRWVAWTSSYSGGDSEARRVNKWNGGLVFIMMCGERVVGGEVFGTDGTSFMGTPCYGPPFLFLFSSFRVIPTLLYPYPVYTYRWDTYK